MLFRSSLKFEIYIQKGDEVQMKNTVVAIDGPAGAGKSTISKAAAKELGFIYIDTGAMYRAVALKALINGYNARRDVQSIIEMLDSTEIEIQHIDDTQNILLNGRNVSDAIRLKEIAIPASDISAISEVRKFLVKLQRRLAGSENVIMDGRDIGTNVLPNADVKIFLTASIEDRAMRRFNEYKERNIECDYDKLKAEIVQRDYKDSTRAVSPLQVAKDAIIIDTTGNELEKSISIIINTIKANIA